MFDAAAAFADSFPLTRRACSRLGATLEALLGFVERRWP
jgi:hypothetical protein